MIAKNSVVKKRGQTIFRRVNEVDRKFEYSLFVK